jgi:hypothetical protein
LRGRLGYRDAVVMLGGDPRALSALDSALAAALSLATGGLSGTVLAAFNADGRVIRIGRDLVVALAARLRGAKGVDRVQRLEAAHTAIVVAAFFDALEASALPMRPLSRDIQVRLSGGGASGRDLVETLLTVAPPRPAAFLPYEHCLEALESWYGEMSARMLSFTEELAIFDGLDGNSRAEADRYFGVGLSGDAVARYQELYARLAVEIPEFGFWAGQVDQQATRSEVRRCLAAIEPLLLSLSPGPEPARAALALSNAYRAVLSRPILSEGQTPAGIRLPTLEESYLDPDFRVSAVQAGELTSDESWWAEVPVRRDLTEYLADALTSPEATAAPLVVLGQPGAGKSVLTKVLAARLPPEGFLPVRVVLREVPADAEVQDQIEHAVRAATGLRLDWPDIAREAGQAIPVVLLDGFDELLQATGVSRSDYLLRLARFQQREADQGRPVIAIVTSRTAVADRVRYPPGTMALRLEPFRDEQIETWLRTWNACNAQLITERSLKPLTAETLVRHRVLASEPLLLLMLALYDADANALQLGGEAADAGMDETVLYEKLLTAFAVREVEKSAEGVAVSELPVLVEQELQRLSLIAFSIMNRRRQWVTAAELDADLTALLGQTASRDAGFRTPLTQGEIALGRFFFIQHAQAMVAGSRLQTFEFLHATFGEYLAARLTVQLAAGLQKRRSPLMVGPAAADDDMLYALLSFAPLSSRQILRFVTSICSRQVPPAARRELSDLLIDVFAASENRTEHRYGGYRPSPLATSSRHGVYSANLVLLMLALEPALSAARLFRASEPLNDPPGMWHRRVLLWRSAMTEPEWTDLALALSIRHTWLDDTRDLDIGLSGTSRLVTEPIDPYWHYHYPPSTLNRDKAEWHRPYWDSIFHKMDISGGTNDSAVRHAIEPVFRAVGAIVTTFHGSADGRSSSLAHDLIQLWLSRTLAIDGTDLPALYDRLSVIYDSRSLPDEQARADAAKLLLDFLHRDAARLQPATVIRHLTAAMNLADRDDLTLQLVLEGALSAMEAGQAGDDERRVLTRIATDALSAAHTRGYPATLEMWLTLHGHPAEYAFLFGDDPETFMAEVGRSQIRETHPRLFQRALATMTARYPGIKL